MKSNSDQKPMILNSPGMFESDGKAAHNKGKPKSRLQEHHEGSGGYEEEEFEGSNEGAPGVAGSGSQPHLKLHKGSVKNPRGQKSPKPQGGSSDFEGTGDQPQIMRIASQGGPISNNYPDSANHKRTRSENPNEINSIEGERSLDPDHEPRKEGTSVAVKQIKPSPSVVEIGGNDGMQSDPSNAGDGDKSFRKGSQGRSPPARLPGRPAHPH